MQKQRSQLSIFIKRFCVLAALPMLMGTVASLAAETPKRILFFGDSLTAGYGVDPDLAYPALIQKIINTDGLNAKVVVGAVSGDTSAGGMRRIDWMLRQPVDIFILALGANDGLRGVATTATLSNLQAIIDQVQAKYPDAAVIIAGMRLPPSLGQKYTDAFAALYPQLAKQNQVALIPFLLEGVGGIVELNLPDRIHPNSAGHEILADTVWLSLQPILRQSQANPSD
jgi:acyl-CoA thioesterase-1|tara:strand:+ start:770 stop:1450 length:681 start_codon:yes stop_codon:yes gene_type:complete